MKQFDWLNKEQYPFRNNYFKLNNINMHYIDEGSGETILFVHGTPSWSFDFRKVISELAKNFRCVAIDHIGFGLSDKPVNYDYTTLNHSNTLYAFIEFLKLKNITLLVHDFGGPIGLNVAINNPDLIKNIIILNSWLWSSEDDVEFKKIKKILNSPLIPFLYKRLNFSPRYILPKSFGEKKINKTLLKQYTKPFANSEQRNGALAFARSLLKDQAWFEELWMNKDVISDKPTLFIWGMKDPVIKPYMLEKFESGFSKHETIKLNTCGHFPQEEEPELVIEAINNFLLKRT